MKVSTEYADKVCAEVTAGTCAADDTFANTCDEHTPLPRRIGIGLQLKVGDTHNMGRPAVKKT